MGPLGTQEMIVIFILALLIFGPKKLPELGRNAAKAIAEFRRASNDLKSQFEREMNSIEKETESLKEVTQSYQNDLYNYDSSYYDSGAYGPDSNDSTSASQSTVGASAIPGAESTAAAEAPGNGAPEGTVAQSAASETATEIASAEAPQPVNGKQAPESSPLAT